MWTPTNQNCEINNRPNFVRFPFEWHSKYARISHLKRNSSAREAPIESSPFSGCDTMAVRMWWTPCNVHKNRYGFCALVMYRACVHGVACVWLLVFAFVDGFFSLFALLRLFYEETSTATIEHFSRCWFTEFRSVVAWEIYTWYKFFARN